MCFANVSFNCKRSVLKKPQVLHENITAHPCFSQSLFCFSLLFRLHAPAFFFMQHISLASGPACCGTNPAKDRNTIHTATMTESHFIDANNGNISDQLYQQKPLFHNNCVFLAVSDPHDINITLQNSNLFCVIF